MVYSEVVQTSQATAPTHTPLVPSRTALNSIHPSGVEVIQKTSTELHGLTAGFHGLRRVTTACYRVW